MTNLDAVLELLAKEAPAKLEMLASDPTAAANLLADYLPKAEPTDLTPDSQESQEAALIERGYLSDAGRTWWRMPSAARVELLVIFEAATSRETICALKELLDQCR